MKEVLKKYTFLVLLASENFLSPNVLKVYFFYASSVLHFAGNFENFKSLKFVKSSKSMLKVYFFHASSVLHFTGNFENFQSLKFVKSSKSMLKVYFSEVLKKYTSQKHERSTKKYTF